MFGGGGSAAGSSTMLAVAAVKSACVNMTLAIDVVTSVGVHVVLLHADSSLSLGRGAGRGGGCWGYATGTRAVMA